MRLLVPELSNISSVNWWEVVTNINVCVFRFLPEGIVVSMKHTGCTFSNWSEHIRICSYCIDPLISSNHSVIGHSKTGIVQVGRFQRFSICRLEWTKRCFLYLKWRMLLFHRTCCLEMLSFWTRWTFSRSYSSNCCLGRCHLTKIDRIMKAYFLCVVINSCSHFI